MKNRWNQWFTKGAQSELHAAYLHRLRTRNIGIRLTQISILLVLLMSWELSTRLGWVDPFIFSSPSRIWDLFIHLTITGGLFRDIGITILETTIGFLLGTIGGTALATLIWAYPFISRVLDPYLVVLNSMPKVALGPLLIVTIGAGFGSIIAMGIAITIVITTLVIHSSFQSVDPHYINLARSFGASRRQIFTSIIFPACIPDMIAALKVNVGLSWVGVVVGEFLVSKEGLGHLIIYGFQVFNLTLVLLSLVIVAFCATAMYQIVALLERHFLRHRHLD
ncbi:ABC transporter permease [Kroppenstedtia pulmonis]|uniref:ABC transporter permease n=1 Tax=Kroppenstedtia pulmonis TaxID=1380685 RepID=A0A7D4BVL8_9BACL|nr:ABC transporter permease [Kroppenstedtia pulmonis]QKG84073.1 ABC transporter permease [Kroppenstedtia pulmonis]